MMKIDEVTVEADPVSSYPKHCVKARVGRDRFSLIHFNKPKAVSQKSFDALMKVVEVEIPSDFEFELELEPEPKKKVKVTGK